MTRVGTGHDSLTSRQLARIRVMTQRTWTGKLFVFRDDDGEHVSLAFPNGRMIPIRAFAVRGPFIPIGLQKTLTLSDTEKWLGDLLRQGFTWEPCIIET